MRYDRDLICSLWASTSESVQALWISLCSVVCIVHVFVKALLTASVILSLAGTAMQRFFCAAHTQRRQASTISTITKSHRISATGAKMMLGRFKLTELGES